jgi:hypothetical protein
MHANVELPALAGNVAGEVRELPMSAKALPA